MTTAIPTSWHPRPLLCAQQGPLHDGHTSIVVECRPSYFPHLYSDNTFSVTPMHLSCVVIIHARPFKSPRHLIRTLTQSRSAANVVKYLTHVRIHQESPRVGFWALPASELPFFGSHNDATSRRTTPEDFQSVVPQLLLCHQLGTMPSRLSPASNQQASHRDTCTKPKATGRCLSLIKRALVYSPKHFSFAFRRQSSKQELAGRRIRAARSKRRAWGVHSVVTCSPSLV